MLHCPSSADSMCGHGRPCGPQSQIDPHGKPPPPRDRETCHGKVQRAPPPALLVSVQRLVWCIRLCGRHRRQLARRLVWCIRLCGRHRRQLARRGSMPLGAVVSPRAARCVVRGRSGCGVSDAGAGQPWWPESAGGGGASEWLPAHLIAVSGSRMQQQRPGLGFRV